jgi:molybdate transport system substrate-binding protein
MTGRVGVRLSALALAVLVAGCEAAGADGDAAGDGPSGEVLVFAAASLTDAFDELAGAFVAGNPEVEVVINFAGSQTLASQINEGAPADVFASANATQMDVVARAGNLAEDPEVFTANRLAIVVEAGNPLGIGRLEDLADPELLVVLPAEEVPAGKYARQALDTAGVAVTPVSLEQDVRAALSKVELGEADASIVYASDVAAAGDRVAGVDIPAEQNVPAAYPIARLADAPSPDVADAFVAFVSSAPGQRILTDHGFTSP